MAAFYLSHYYSIFIFILTLTLTVHFTLSYLTLLVYRAEGKYPNAMASDFWPFVFYSQTHTKNDLLRYGSYTHEQ